MFHYSAIAIVTASVPWWSEFPRNIKKNFLGSKGRQVRGADNLAAIYEPIV
jgi:hypothetical protein